MKIPFHPLILATLCLLLCACNETRNPENTADSEDLGSASAVQSENPASSTEESSGSAPQTEGSDEPYVNLSTTATLTPGAILTEGATIWTEVKFHDSYADDCDPATVKEIIYSIRPELFTNTSAGGDTISILYPVIDIPDAPEFAEALNQEIQDFMWLDAPFPDCELGYMHLTGTFAITWADRTHFSIVCYYSYLYHRLTNNWYGITVDVAARRKMTLSDISITAESMEALLFDPDARYDEFLGYYVKSDGQLKEWVSENLKPETNDRFFIACSPYIPEYHSYFLDRPNSLYIPLLWPYCMGGAEEVIIKVPFEFGTQNVAGVFLWE